MCSIYISGLVDITVKKGRWSAYEVKTEKSCPHVPSIMRGLIEACLGDAVGMNRKVILERDDSRQLSATIAPIPPPPTAESIAEKSIPVNLWELLGREISPLPTLLRGRFCASPLNAQNCTL